MKVNQPIVSKFIQCTNKTAWFSFVGKIEDDQGFYCFSKVPDFVCCLGWPETNQVNRDASQNFCAGRRKHYRHQTSKVLKFVLSGTSGNDGSNVSSRLCWCEQPNHYHDSFTFNHLHLQVPCTQMECLTSQPVTSSYLSGAPNVNFRKIKISVRKTI